MSYSNLVIYYDVITDVYFEYPQKRKLSSFLKSDGFVD
jgi:hypothetical protein